MFFNCRFLEVNGCVRCAWALTELGGSRLEAATKMVKLRGSQRKHRKEKVPEKFNLFFFVNETFVNINGFGLVIKFSPGFFLIL